MVEIESGRRRSALVRVGLAFAVVALVARLAAELDPSSHIEWMDAFGLVAGGGAAWLGFQVLLWLVPALAAACVLVLALRERGKRRLRRDA